jgi:hypothetical protein
VPEATPRSAALNVLKAIPRYIVLVVFYPAFGLPAV